MKRVPRRDGWVPRTGSEGRSLNVRRVFFVVVAICPVGYTMRDIRYKWNEGPNSVGVSNEVSLPQFKVLGHRQRAMEISLTTGNVSDENNTSDAQVMNNNIFSFIGKQRFLSVPSLTDNVLLEIFFNAIGKFEGRETPLC